jgi:D-alanyl-D-alanine carboxypeptidase
MKTSSPAAQAGTVLVALAAFTALMSISASAVMRERAPAQNLRDVEATSKQEMIGASARQTGEARDMAGRLRALLEGCIDREHRDPLHNAVLLVEGPGFKYKGAAGMADGVGEPMTPNHKFKIASISKSFTATVVLQLVEEGRLHLDDTLSEFFSGSPVVRLDSLFIYDGVSYGREVTIEQLLGHTSGLNCYLAGDPRFIEYILENPGTQWTPAMMLEKYYEYHLNRKPFFPPGEGWEYTDTNYLLLAMIIEEVTGSPLHAEYESRILRPLGMENTYLEFYEGPRGSQPLSHAFYGGMDLYPDVNTSFDWGGGGIVSNCDDLNTFFRALLGGDLFEEDVTLERMLAATVDEDRWNYGFGIKRKIINGRTFYGHPGAYNCDAYYCPEEDVSICLTINQMNSHDRKEALREGAIDVVLPE